MELFIAIIVVAAEMKNYFAQTESGISGTVAKQQKFRYNLKHGGKTCISNNDTIAYLLSASISSIPNINVYGRIEWDR